MPYGARSPVAELPSGKGLRSRAVSSHCCNQTRAGTTPLAASQSRAQAHQPMIQRSKLGPNLLLALLVSSPIAGCAGSPRTTEFEGEDDPVVDFASLRVELEPVQQILEGFGASVAWYGELFTQHPNRAELAQILFTDLGIDILRLRNQYNATESAPDPAGLEVYRSAESTLGHPLRVLLTSWSPPAALKKSGLTRCTGTADDGCTLRLNADGSFPYDEFASYWLESILAYRASGLDPYYVSIQNEPDFAPSGWDGCRFEPTEQPGSFPGYDRALEAVAARLQTASISTRFVGADTAHLANGRVISYVAATGRTLYGVAHHLYDGSTWQGPDSFYSAMSDLATAVPDLPKFQTEFSPTDTQGQAVQGGFEVAWLIHDSIAFEHASAYLHWELFWPNSGLVAIENPQEPSKWTTTRGYALREPYHAVRHYARYTSPGDRVLTVASEGSPDVRATAYLDPAGSRLTLVLLNVAKVPRHYSLDLSGFRFSASLNVLTTPDTPWQVSAPVTPDAVSKITLPPKSIQTLVFATDPTLLQ